AGMVVRGAVQTRMEALLGDSAVLLNWPPPGQRGRYAGLAADPRVLRVLALSGGYSREQACSLLAREPCMIASFSRALLEGLTDQQSDEQFHAQLDSSIGQIFAASADKAPAGG